MIPSTSGMDRREEAFQNLFARGLIHALFFHPNLRSITMFSYNKRFIVAALFALTPFVSLTPEARSQHKHHGGHHHGHGFHHNWPGAGAQDSGGSQPASVSITEPNPADLLNALTHAYEMEMSRKLTYEQLKRERLETKWIMAEYERR